MGTPPLCWPGDLERPAAASPAAADPSSELGHGRLSRLRARRRRGRSECDAQAAARPEGADPRSRSLDHGLRLRRDHRGGNARRLSARALCARHAGEGGPHRVFPDAGTGAALARLNMREAGSGLFRNEVVENPFVWGALALCTLLIVAAIYAPGLSSVLGMTSPGGAGWTLALCFSVLPLLLGQTAISFRRTLQASVLRSHPPASLGNRNTSASGFSGTNRESR